MKNITDIFFDLDHTLWDFEKNSALAFATIFAKFNMNIHMSEFLSHYVPLNFAYWIKYRNEEITQEDLRYRRLKDTFDLLSYEIDDTSILKISDAYVEDLPTYNHLFEGATEILDYLNTKYRLHIITNGIHDIQDRKIRNANLSHYFATVTNSETAGAKKPNPAIFEHAIKLAAVQKENCIMIGDCMEADVRGALNCGIDAIWFSNDTCGDATIKTVSALAELKKYL